MSRFFSSWPTWEKLVFILACAIVVTILLGCAKLGYTHWKLRRYTAVAEKEKIEQGLQRQMSQRKTSHRQKSQRRRTTISEGPDVPFGIRAIESGIEVDGVWISRNNTPEPVKREQSTSLSVWDHVPRKEYEVEKVGMQQPHEHSNSRSTTGTARVTSSAFDRAVATETATSTNTSRESSPGDLIAKPPKVRHPPTSFPKFSVNPCLLRPDPASSTLQGIEAVFNAAGPIRNDHANGEYSSGSNESSYQSTYDSTNTEPIAASAPRLLNQQTRSRESSNDLDLMHTHRMSLAAETGHFTPRARRPGNSGARASIATRHSVSEPDDYFNQQVSSPLPTETSPTQGLPSNPLALPDAIRRSSLPDVTPFAKFCQTAPASPHPDTSRLASADWPPASPSRTSIYSKYISAPPSPSVIAHAVELPAVVTAHDTAQVTPQHSRRSSFEHRKSNVLRGHGSGFEILRPGSLNPAMPAEDSTEQRAGPPISLHNNGGSRQRSNSADSRRKLQKRRPSDAFQKSVEVEAGHMHRRSFY